MMEYLNKEIMDVFLKYKKDVAEESKGKYIYYLMRDFLGYGKIDVIMKDHKIEDISCNGVNTPIYVFHKDYESLPTNIIYETEKELSTIITRLAYKAKQQISVAHPILEGTLPEGHRAHITLDEISKRGDTFTIRKYSENPLTIVDLINFGTISLKIASYLWILVENLRSIMICGATASGKTALLNSICMFINPEKKVVTIERR
jgi:flagellar protein FlaI